MLCYACGLTDRLARLLQNCSSEYSGLLLAAGGVNSRLIVGNIDKNDGPRGSRARCGRGSAEVSQVLPHRVVGRPSGTTYRLKPHARVARQRNNALVPCPATVWGTHCDCEITTERAMGQRLAVRSLTCLSATGTHMPYRIIQYYLPPDKGDIPAFTPAEAGTRLSDPGGMQG